MRIGPAILAIPRRIQKDPLVWATCLLSTLLIFLPESISLDLRLDWAHYGYATESPVIKALLQLGVFIILMVLSPLAWQWTGDDRPVGYSLRSLIQTVGLVLGGYALFQLPIRLLAGQKPVFNDHWLIQDLYSFLMAAVIVYIFGQFIASRDLGEENIEKAERFTPRVFFEQEPDGVELAFLRSHR